MKMKKYDWKNIIKENTPGRPDCQMVSAINAYYILTGNIIERSSERYEEYCRIARCMAGAALCIDEVYKDLGLKRTTKLRRLPWDHNNPKIKKSEYKKFLPLEAHIWYKRTGFHSVLIFDFEPITDSVRVSGFQWGTNSLGWMYWEDFQHYLTPSIGARIDGEDPWDTQQIELI